LQVVPLFFFLGSVWGGTPPFLLFFCFGAKGVLSEGPGGALAGGGGGDYSPNVRIGVCREGS